MLEAGELLHVISRRMFEEEVRRHFAGEVESVSDAVARVRGYAFVYDGARNAFVRRGDVRTRLFGLADAGNIVNVLPDGVVLENLAYEVASDGRLVLTDGQGFQLDINEFGAKR